MPDRLQTPRPVRLPRHTDQRSIQIAANFDLNRSSRLQTIKAARQEGTRVSDGLGPKSPTHILSLVGSRYKKTKSPFPERTWASDATTNHRSISEAQKEYPTGTPARACVVSRNRDADAGGLGRPPRWRVWRQWLRTASATAAKHPPPCLLRWSAQIRSLRLSIALEAGRSVEQAGSAGCRTTGSAGPACLPP